MTVAAAPRSGPKAVGALVLLLPYLAWSTFALCLNFAVWQLNN
jgi:tryptophan-rich sensory protein